MLTVRQLERFDEIERDWRALHDRALFRTVFQTWEWNAAWWQHLRQGFERLFLLAVYDGETMVGLAPFRRHRRSVQGIIHFDVLSFIGHPHTDYLDVLVDRQRASEAWQALAGWLRRNRHLWSLIELREIAEDSPSHMLLQRAFRDRKFSCIGKTDSVCPRIVLPSTMDEYLSGLSSETRKKSRKNIRRLQAQGRVVYEKGGPEQIDDFFRLNTARWHKLGQQGSVPLEKLRRFHRDISRMLEQQLDLWFLSVDGKRIAVQYSYDWNGTRGVYLQGMDMDYEYFSPGITIMMNRIDAAIAAGKRYYDLMRGDEPYKFHYAKDVRHNRQYTIAHSAIAMKRHLLFERLSGLRDW